MAQSSPQPTRPERAAQIEVITGIEEGFPQGADLDDFFLMNLKEQGVCAGISREGLVEHDCVINSATF